MSGVPSTARVVVIGGGVVGASSLFHLAKAGWTDCVLLEKNELTAGSTWHAAGNVPTFSTSWSIMNMQRYSAELYRGLGEAVDYPMNYHRDRLDPARRIRSSGMQEFERAAGMGRYQGMDLEILGPEEIRARYPFLETPRPDRRALRSQRRRHRPGPADPGAGQGRPRLGRADRALLPGDGGAPEERRVDRPHAQGRRPLRISWSTRPAITPARVGEWFGPRRADRADDGDEPPVSAVRRRSRSSRPGREDAAASCRCCATSIQLLLPAAGEDRASTSAPTSAPAARIGRRPDDPMPEDFSFQLFPDDLDRLEWYIEDAMARVPLLGEARLSKVINGPIPYTPDGNPADRPDARRAERLRGLRLHLRHLPGAAAPARCWPNG